MDAAVAAIYDMPCRGIKIHDLTQEKHRVNTDPFLHRIYTIGLYTV